MNKRMGKVMMQNDRNYRSERFGKRSASIRSKMNKRAFHNAMRNDAKVAIREC